MGYPTTVVSDFEQSIDYVLANEKGFSDNPDDMGAATNFGISTPMLAIARGSSVTIEDVRTLSLEEAKSIYRKYFWDKLKLEELPQNIATALLDASVNMGEHHATFFAQLAIGMKCPDGILGNQTRHLIYSANQEFFLHAFVGEILDYYCNIVSKNQTQIVFLKGWIRRAFRLMTLIEN